MIVIGVTRSKADPVIKTGEETTQAAESAYVGAKEFFPTPYNDTVNVIEPVALVDTKSVMASTFIRAPVIDLTMIATARPDDIGPSVTRLSMPAGPSFTKRLPNVVSNNT